MFSVTPARSGTATFVTTGSIDTAIEAFSLPFCLPLFSSIGCADGGGTGTNARLSVSVTAGTTYYIVIAGSGGSSTLVATLP